MTLVVGEVRCSLIQSWNPPSSAGTALSGSDETGGETGTGARAGSGSGTEVGFKELGVSSRSEGAGAGEAMNQ